MREGIALAKPEWGTKRICHSCGTRFYDLLRAPIVCPSCGTEFDPEALLRTRRSRSVVSEREPVAVGPEAPEAEAPEEEIEVEPEATEAVEDEEEAEEATVDEEGGATDTGGGSNFSMLPTMAAAYEVAQLRGQSLHPAQLWWLATQGSARALRVEEKIGNLAPGMEADLIVIGTHGRGVMAHLPMGSVAERVLRTARCPVLTVRHPEREFVLPDAFVAAAAAVAVA